MVFSFCFYYYYYFSVTFPVVCAHLEREASTFWNEGFDRLPRVPIQSKIYWGQKVYREAQLNFRGLFVDVSPIGKIIIIGNGFRIKDPMRLKEKEPTATGRSNLRVRSEIWLRWIRFGPNPTLIGSKLIQVYQDKIKDD